MHILDQEKLKKAIEDSSFRSIANLARNLRFHRNALPHFFAARSVFPVTLEKTFTALDLDARDFLIRQKPSQPSMQSQQQIARVVDQLVALAPHLVWVGFGSRFKGGAKKYSDLDLGVYSSEGIRHEVYRGIVRKKEELGEALPFQIDLIHLNRADQAFFSNIALHWQFLGGSYAQWLRLQQQVDERREA